MYERLQGTHTRAYFLRSSCVKKNPTLLRRMRGGGRCQEEGCTKAALQATRLTASRMVAVDAASKRVVPRQLCQAVRRTASRTAADAARRRAAPRELQAVVLFTAWRMAAASAAGRMTASS